MVVLVEFVCGLVIGYSVASYIESVLHEHVSDAPISYVRKWRKHPRLCRALINTNFSHHIVHHFMTFRESHVTQFRSEKEKQHLRRVLLKRGRHGRVIIGGDYANKLHAEGAIVFCLPALIVGIVSLFFLPFALVCGMLPMLCLPPLLSYFVHPYLHMSFARGQSEAPTWLAMLLRTGYMRAVYRNHFIHHRYGGSSNYNLMLGADIVRRRVRAVSGDDYSKMRDIGIPVH